MRYLKPFLILSAFLGLASIWTMGRAAAAGASRSQFGQPLDGLTLDDRKVFRDAKDTFEEVEDAADGLGPIFNGVSCAACHSTPAVGGASAINETRAQKKTPQGQFELPGGSLFQSQAIRPDCAEVIPPDANVIALRQTTPLFGSGLIEAVPDAQIEAYANLETLVYPNQAGRVNHITDVASGKTRVGRFGWKAQQATLLAFSGDAYVNEMGITNRFFPTENAPNGDLNKLHACDAVPDPEDKSDDVTAFANFMRMLAPPPRDFEWDRLQQTFRNRIFEFYRNPRNSQQVRALPRIARGELLFEEVGCAICHRSGFTTVSQTPALNRQKVEAYSDFLLHDVGTGDGIIQGDPQSVNELRTPPLWGISASAPYLHDGSAASIRDAIERHDNQAAGPRKAFDQLSGSEQDALLAFLDSI